MQKKLFIKFSVSISLYYISYAIIIGFSALFLQSKGFSNTEIGVFFASSAILCVFIQCFFGSFLDKHPEISVKTLIFLSSIIVFAAVITLFFLKPRGAIMVCYIIAGSLMLAISSFFNSFGMEYINAQIPLNYSLARGIGSFFYAVVFLFMGFVIKSFKITSIFPAFFISECLFLLCVVTIQPAHKSAPPNLEQEKYNFFSFFHKNPAVFFLLINILLIYISYTSINNFHINIIKSVGGGSQELGISASLGALLELPAMALFVPVSKKFSYRSLLLFSCTFFFIKTFSLLFAESVTAVYLSQCLQFFSYGLFVPASAYFLNSILSIKDKAKGQSALGIFTFGLGGLFSSLLSGIVLDSFPVKTLILLLSTLAFAGLAGVFWSCHLLKKKSMENN